MVSTWKQYETEFNCEYTKRIFPRRARKNRAKSLERQTFHTNSITRLYTTFTS